MWIKYLVSCNAIWDQGTAQKEICKVFLSLEAFKIGKNIIVKSYILITGMLWYRVETVIIGAIVAVIYYKKAWNFGYLNPVAKWSSWLSAAH